MGPDFFFFFFFWNKYLIPSYGRYCQMFRKIFVTLLSPQCLCAGKARLSKAELFRVLSLLCVFKQSLYLPRNTTFRPSNGLSQEDQFNSVSTIWNKVLKYISKLHWRLNFLRYYFFLLLSLIDTCRYQTTWRDITTSSIFPTSCYYAKVTH